MASFFGCPTFNPISPRAIAAHRESNLGVIARQIIFSEKIKNERILSNRSEARIFRFPCIAIERACIIATFRPWDILVWVPVLLDLKMAFEFDCYDWFEITNKT
jgi:hypothetical protein